MDKDSKTNLSFTEKDSTKLTPAFKKWLKKKAKESAIFKFIVREGKNLFILKYNHKI
jgi:hypothetical protein